MTLQLQQNNFQSSVQNYDSNISQANSDKSNFNETPPTALKSDDHLINIEQRNRQLQKQLLKQKQFNAIRNKFDQEIEKKQIEIYMLSRQIFELHYSKSEKVPSLKKKLVQANMEHHLLIQNKHNQLLNKKKNSNNEYKVETINMKPQKINFKQQKKNQAEASSSSNKFHYLVNQADLIKQQQYESKYIRQYIPFQTEIKLIELRADSQKIASISSQPEIIIQQINQLGQQNKGDLLIAKKQQGNNSDNRN